MEAGEAYLYRQKPEWNMKEVDHEKVETENDSRYTGLCL